MIDVRSVLIVVVAVLLFSSFSIAQNYIDPEDPRNNDINRYIDPSDNRELEPTRYVDELPYTPDLLSINNVMPTNKNIDLNSLSDSIIISPIYNSSSINLDINADKIISDSNASDIYVLKSGDTMSGQLINQASIVVGTGNDTVNIGTSNRAIIFGNGGDGNIRTTDSASDLIIGKSGTNGGSVNISGYDAVSATGTGSGGFNLSSYQWFRGNGIDMGDASNRWGDIYPNSVYFTDLQKTSYGAGNDLNIYHNNTINYNVIESGQNVNLGFVMNDNGTPYFPIVLNPIDGTYGERLTDLSGGESVKFPATTRRGSGVNTDTFDASLGNTYTLNINSNVFSNYTVSGGTGLANFVILLYGNLLTYTAGVGTDMYFASGGQLGFSHAGGDFIVYESTTRTDPLNIYFNRNATVASTDAPRKGDVLTELYFTGDIGGTRLLQKGGLIKASVSADWNTTGSESHPVPDYNRATEIGIYTECEGDVNCMKTPVIVFNDNQDTNITGTTLLSDDLNWVSPDSGLASANLSANNITQTIELTQNIDMNILDDWNAVMDGFAKDGNSIKWLGSEPIKVTVNYFIYLRPEISGQFDIQSNIYLNDILQYNLKGENRISTTDTRENIVGNGIIIMQPNDLLTLYIRNITNSGEMVILDSSITLLGVGGG